MEEWLMVTMALSNFHTFPLHLEISKGKRKVDFSVGSYKRSGQVQLILDSNSDKTLLEWP